MGRAGREHKAQQRANWTINSYVPVRNVRSLVGAMSAIVESKAGREGGVRHRSGMSMNVECTERKYDEKHECEHP